MREQEENNETESDKDTTIVAFDGETYIACDEAYVNATSRYLISWVANPSASFPITPHVDFFSSYTTSNYG